MAIQNIALPNRRNLNEEQAKILAAKALASIAPNAANANAAGVEYMNRNNPSPEAAQADGSYVLARNDLPQEAFDFVNPDIPLGQPEQVIEQVPVQEMIAPAANPVTDSTQRSIATEPADKLMGELDKAQAGREAKFKTQEDERQKRIDNVLTKLDRIEQRGPFKFDDRSLWAKSSTGQKVALLIGGFLSSLHETGARSFQEGVKSTIERDLALQNKMFDEGKAEKNSLIETLNKELGNRESANLAWESMIYKGISDKLAFQRDNAQSQQQKLQADRAYQLAAREYDLKRNEAMAKATNTAADNTIPGYSGQIKDDVERRKFSEAVQASQSIKEQIQNLRKITAQTGKSVNPKAKADAEVAIGAIMSDLKAFKQLGTLDKGVENLIGKLVQNPTDFFSLDSSSLAKLNSFEKYINGGLEKAAKINKLSPTGPSSYVKVK